MIDYLIFDGPTLMFLAFYAWLLRQIVYPRPKQVVKRLTKLNNFADARFILCT